MLAEGGRLVRSAAAEALAQIEGKGLPVPVPAAPGAVQEWFAELHTGLEGLLER